MSGICSLRANKYIKLLMILQLMKYHYSTTLIILQCPSYKKFEPRSVKTGLNACAFTAHENLGRHLTHMPSILTAWAHKLITKTNEHRYY